jgi:hypothetical protein
MRAYRQLGWFKHGVQYDVKCNGLTAAGKPAKPAITVFSYDDTRADAVALAIAELNRYGYTNLTADKIVRYK